MGVQFDPSISSGGVHSTYDLMGPALEAQRAIYEELDRLVEETNQAIKQERLEKIYQRLAQLSNRLQKMGVGGLANGQGLSNIIENIQDRIENFFQQTGAATPERQRQLQRIRNQLADLMQQLQSF